MACPLAEAATARSGAIRLSPPLCELKMPPAGWARSLAVRAFDVRDIRRHQAVRSDSLPERTGFELAVPLTSRE
jgi:hypothetical protein